MRCRAKQVEDRMVCRLCLREWKVDDPNPPECTEYFTKAGSGHERRINRPGEKR